MTEAWVNTNKPEDRSVRAREIRYSSGLETLDTKKGVYKGYILGLYRDSGKENGNYRGYRGDYRVYIGAI